MKLPRSTYQSIVKVRDDTVVEQALEALVSKHPAIGFWSCYYRLRNKGYVWNHKRVRRVYRKLNLNIRRKPKKRLPERAIKFKHSLVLTFPASAGLQPVFHRMITFMT